MITIIKIVIKDIYLKPLLEQIKDQTDIQVGPARTELS